MRLPTYLIRSVIIGLAVLFLATWSAIAANGACNDLSKVKPDELLALPELVGLCNYPPPGVSCDSTGYGPASNCEQRLTVTQDHMLGSTRRIIAIHSSPPRPWFSGPWPSDGVYVFGCVAGQIKAVSGGNCRPESDSKVEYENLLHDRSRGFNGDNLESETSSKSVSCKTLKTMSADDLVAVPGSRDDNMFDDGLGCQKLEDDQEGCTWMATIREDRTLPGGRRLIIVNRNCEMCTSDDDYVFVFGCVSGKVRKVFNDSFGAGVAIVDASADNFVLSASDWQERDARCCPSVKKTMTYVWNADLQNYILRGMQLKKISGSH